MAENGLSEQVERIEQKLDKQFTEVQEHFVEQRKYIEFAYDKMDQRVTAGFSRLDQRVDDLDKRMTEGFARLDQRIDGLDMRMTDGFSRLERKFDQFIDTKSRPASATSHRARPSKRRR